VLHRGARSKTLAPKSWLSLSSSNGRTPTICDTRSLWGCVKIKDARTAIKEQTGAYSG
jgi:hypothetical protein